MLPYPQSQSMNNTASVDVKRKSDSTDEATPFLSDQQELDILSTAVQNQRTTRCALDLEAQAAT